MGEAKKQSHILLVEDEKTLHEAYKMILERAGYRVSTSYNGYEALEHLDSHPDLVLLDLRMPKMDGITFLQHAKFLERKNAPEVVIFTNYDVQKEIDDAFKLGAVRYILKAHATPSDLLKIVKDTLKNKKVRKSK